MQKPEATPFTTKGFAGMRAQDVVEILDAGRAYADGNAPRTIRFGDADVCNPRRDAAPQSMLGAAQKTWLLDTLRQSRAHWKLWGNSVAMLDWRLDLQKLRDIPGMPNSWPSSGYAQFGDDDWAGYFH